MDSLTPSSVCGIAAIDGPDVQSVHLIRITNAESTSKICIAAGLKWPDCICLLEECLTDAYVYIYIAVYSATQHPTIYCAHNMTHNCNMEVCNHTLHAQGLTADVLLTDCRF